MQKKSLTICNPIRCSTKSFVQENKNDNRVSFNRKINCRTAQKRWGQPRAKKQQTHSSRQRNTDSRSKRFWQTLSRQHNSIISKPHMISSVRLQSSKSMISSATKRKRLQQRSSMQNPNIKTVLRKDGAHEGQFRTQQMKYLAGIDTKETTHVESGVKMRIDVERVYFSPRLSTERLRIARLIKSNEDVMFFSQVPRHIRSLLPKKTESENNRWHRD